MTHKSLIRMFGSALLIVGGAVSVMAQADDETPATFGHGWMHQQGNGPGMMAGHGNGMMMGLGQGMMSDNHEPMMLAVAEALALEPEALVTALHDGQTLTEIAEAQGVELETLSAVMFAQAVTHTAAMVDAGYITQEQANEHLAWVSENMTEMPMFAGGEFSPCMHGQAGSGSMGRGPGRGMMGF